MRKIFEPKKRGLHLSRWELSISALAIMLISALSVRLRLSSGNFSRKSSFRSVHSETRIEPGGNGCR